MRIFAIDDEQAMLMDLHDAIAEAEPDAEIMDFKRPAKALEAISGGCIPDVVFSDIQMPGMDGLALAAEIKKLAPGVKIVFVTGYSQYAIEAYRRHVRGYVLKPTDAAMIREELDNLEPMQAQYRQDRLRVQCFGFFEVFWQDRPLSFARSKTKELFAYLVDREGAFCTAGEIICALWEDDTEVKDAGHYLRILSSDLTASLDAVGQRDVLLKERGRMAVNRSLIECDYYRMLDGDMQAVNAFQGDYMAQYSWAELTAGRLSFKGR